MANLDRIRHRPKARELITETWQSQANLSLFLALLVFTGFVLPSLGFGRSDLRLYSDLVFSVLLISGVSIAFRRRKLFLFAASFAAVTLVLRWIGFWSLERTWELWGNSWSIAAVAIISVILLSEVFREGPVTSARIQGAIAVYLLFGVAWAHAYQIANTVQPGSFSSAAGQLSNVGDWSYYSFVTLTTLGYGDITPLSAVARSLAVGEALAGQLYLAVLIARLVAMEVISWQEKASRRRGE